MGGEVEHKGNEEKSERVDAALEGFEHVFVVWDLAVVEHNPNAMKR